MHRPVLGLGFVATIVCCSMVVGDDKPPAEPLDAGLSYRFRHGEAFVTAVKVEKSAPGTSYMPCDFGKGLYGLREYNGKRLIYFQVAETRYDAKARGRGFRLLYADPETRIIRNDDGTPRRMCQLAYNWKDGETYHLAVSAEIDGDLTEYTAWFHVPRRKSWRRLATYSLPTGGRDVDNLFATVQEAGGKPHATGRLRSVVMGPAWFREDGEWKPVRKARFGDERKTATNVDGGPRGAGFFLAIGGDTQRETTKFGDEIEVKVTTPPAGLLESLDAALR